MKNRELMGKANERMQFFRFTKTQVQTAQLILQGLTNQEIADRLFVGVGAVKWNITKMLKQSGTKNKCQLMSRLLGLDPKENTYITLPMGHNDIFKIN